MFSPAPVQMDFKRVYPNRLNFRNSCCPPSSSRSQITFDDSEDDDSDSNVSLQTESFKKQQLTNKNMFHQDSDESCNFSFDENAHSNTMSPLITLQTSPSTAVRSIIASYLQDKNKYTQVNDSGEQILWKPAGKCGENHCILQKNMDNRLEFTEKIPKISDRNTASMFRRFPVFSCHFPPYVFDLGTPPALVKQNSCARVQWQFGEHITNGDLLEELKKESIRDEPKNSRRNLYNSLDVHIERRFD
ncbi:unnamed protein product [Rotaria magnacalcarata]|uniref:Uncharacterized protein n=1 Tax=Rotaria magnacalcarata TaxID=392030 RepID=A0A819BSF6_9BILA|nr:unnamed protein product [Rotaria magnacalcarata]